MRSVAPLLRPASHRFFGRLENACAGLIVALLAGYYGFVSFVRPISPYYRDYDPEFQYFMNSLAIFKGHSYFFLDHPGTPVEIIGTGLLLLIRGFVPGSTAQFVDFQLQHPGFFFGLAGLFLTSCSIGCALLLYREVLRAGGPGVASSIVAVCIALLYYVVHPEALKTLVLWSHNSFGFPFATLFLWALLALVTRPQGVLPWQALLLGLCAGLLTAIVVYWTALIVSTVVVLIGLGVAGGCNRSTVVRRTVTFLLASLLGFLLSLLPAVDRVPYFVAWIAQLIGHQGAYGGGQAGLTSLPMVWQHWVALVARLPVLVAATLIAEILLVLGLFRGWAARHAGSGSWAMGLGLSVQLPLLLFMDLKHPAINTDLPDLYVLSIAASLPICGIIALRLFGEETVTRRLLYGLLIGGVALGLVWAIPNAFRAHEAKLKMIALSVEDAELAVSRVPAGSAVLWTYGSYSKCYSLWFGNEYTGGAFTTEVSGHCGRQYALNIWGAQVDVDGAWKPVSQFGNWSLILTRQDLVDQYPFLQQLGSSSQGSSTGANTYGPIIFISHGAK